MSREAGSLLDGLGAIELRGQYPGKTVIRAEAPGVASGELTLTITGEEPWDGREPVPMTPPPTKVGPPKRLGLDEIGVYRPVFCSSETVEHPSKSVTDGDWATSWEPADGEPGQWVMVDLEGTKDFAEIHLSFTQIVQEEFQVDLSDDRQEFREIFRSGDRPETTDFILSGLEERARFIRLRFPGKAYPVRSIGVYV